ncbi:fumarate hydratase [Candidatus Omnitrophota bacterium]
MRKISSRKITEAVAQLCLRANTDLRSDVYQALKKAEACEKSNRARQILKVLLENAACARRLKLAICQDTGLPHVFVELGQGVQVTGGDLVAAINRGVAQGYKKGYLRNSVIAHPLKRKVRPGYTPALVQLDLVKGSRLKLTVFPKGFGSENKSALMMFNPTAGIEAVKNFVVDTVKAAGANACPPFIVGVGIGAAADSAGGLAKKALLRRIDRKNPDKLLAGLEKDLLQRINQLGLGPSGLGGATTSLGVNILTGATHIAGLPVAVNISCHALRSATKTI